MFKMKGKNPLRGIVKPENTPWEGLLYEGTVFCLQTFKNITKIQISEIIDRDPEAVRKELDRIIKKSSLSHWIIVTRDENNKKVFNSTPELKEISLKVACTIGRMTWDVYARIDLQVQDKLDKQKPNKPEYYLIDLLKNLSLNYRYVGNGKPENRIKINGKNPDFINEKDKTNWNLIKNDLKNILVTTFKSAKGMEFDTVIVLEFQLLNENLKQQFFVGCTRARANLFLFCKDELPTLLNQNYFVETYTLQDNRNLKKTINLIDDLQF